MAEPGPHSPDGSRLNCETCRRRKVKGCDNGQPHCNNCIAGGLSCGNSSRSFPANVASSAAGLLRDTFSSNADLLSATLSEALQEGSKAGTSSSVAGSRSSLNHPPATSEFAIATGATSENETFRSGSRPPNVAREAFDGMTIDQFLQSENASQGGLFELDQQLDKGKKPFYSKSNGDVTSNSYDAVFNSAWQPGAVGKASTGPGTGPLNDGDEVVKLLSDPTFQPELWTEDNSGEPYTVTEQEMQISRWYTQHTQAGVPQREQLQHAVAAARRGRAYEEFASIFDEIESYQEDVWGHIRPLVEAARQERLAAEPNATRDGPAVHRLRMIVAHLQLSTLSGSAEAPSHSTNLI